MARLKVLVLGFALIVLAACGGAEPPGTTDDGASQVPPADAGPVQVANVELITRSEGAGLRIDGTQPTPCHEVGWIVEPGDGRVDVTLWSEPPPTGTACAQVIEPFSIEIDLGSVETETEVVLNGEVVGSVS